MYGGGEKCYGTGEIMIDKMVRNPQTGIFVDNLGVYDPHFAASTDVLFRLTIKNIGQAELRDIKVKDIFPDYIQFTWGPDGWDADKRELNFTIDVLGAGQSKEFEIMTKVYPKNMLPTDSDLICKINKAQVDKDNDGDVDASDEARFCISNKVLGISTMPATGMPNGWLLVVGCLVIGSLGTKLAFSKKE